MEGGTLPQRGRGAEKAWCAHMMTITSRKNPRVAHFKKLAASGEYRYACGEYICDGWKLYGEAQKWGAAIREIMVTQGQEGTYPPGAQVYLVTPEVMEAASPMRTPQGIVFTVEIPETPDEVELAGALILENIQDPGNVGTVLRTANAFDIPLVALAGSCADVWSPKTVRASMGAVFRQRTARLTLPRLAELSAGVPIYGAALREDARDIRTLALGRAAVAVGNEGSGLSRELLGLCAGTVIIPMSPRCESLNAAVAASLVMWEMARGRLPGQDR